MYTLNSNTKFIKPKMFLRSGGSYRPYYAGKYLLVLIYIWQTLYMKLLSNQL